MWVEGLLKYLLPRHQTADISSVLVDPHLMIVWISGSLSCASLGCMTRAPQHTSRARVSPAAATWRAPDSWQLNGTP